MISNFLNILRLLLLPMIQSILDNNPCTLEKNVIQLRLRLCLSNLQSQARYCQTLTYLPLGGVKCSGLCAFSKITICLAFCAFSLPFTKSHAGHPWECTQGVSHGLVGYGDEAYKVLEVPMAG